MLRDLDKPATVSCPNCRKPVEWSAASRFKPFCCERCRLIDLGEWASEARRIAGDPATDEEPPSGAE